MRILQLCKKFPFPVKDGEAVDIFNMSKGFAENGCSVTLLAMNTVKHFVEDPALQDHVGHFESVYTVQADTSVRFIDAVSNLFSDKSYHIERFTLDAFRTKLGEIIGKEKFDVIQLESLYMTPYINTIRKMSHAIISMRAHNVEYEIWDDLSAQAQNPVKKWYFKLCADRLKKYELQQLHKYDFLVPITGNDLQKYRALGYRKNALAAPTGLDVSQYKVHSQSHKGLSLCFLGSLDWLPNLEGLKWFLDRVWPGIHTQYPEMEFHIAGRGPDFNHIRNKTMNVFVHGEVEDAIAFLGKHDIQIVPLFSGSGLRIKILESMALGQIVITTSKGIAGVEADADRHFLLANTPEEFVQCLERCLCKPRMIKAMSENASALVENKYNYTKNVPLLLDHYRALTGVPKQSSYV